jgi:hypothetical protein
MKYPINSNGDFQKGLDLQAHLEEKQESPKLRYKTLIGSALGYAADGLDMFLLSFVLVFIIKEFNLTTLQAGNLTL